ncbi:hypothetical protein Y032_0114g431 [Ancylostoma ceylanicum]|uniref:Lysozyme n=1 Tax=Ancylostoma ceylanicum TaxID=53326 RepID=A0A016TDC2_9BILA|nr:hypothetical protein Y032_0114g431 [Ancylostoma ceylanicum]
MLEGASFLVIISDFLLLWPSLHKGFIKDTSMLVLVLFCSLALSGLGSPVVQEQTVSKSATVSYAVDLSAPAPTSTFQCIRQSSYGYAFLRAYSPAGQGQLDPNACNNIKNAYAAGLNTEAYMTPVPKSSKTGAQQFDEMYGGLRNCFISVLSIWIQVTSPVNWHASTAKNVDFINSILTRARQYGIDVAVYTNVYEWNQITGGATITNVQLWYWNAYGAGATKESPADYDDFRSFGGWTTPSAKQFGQVEFVCGVTLNRDIISVSNSAESIEMEKHEKSEQIVVGTLGRGSVVSGQAEIKQ